MTTRTHAELREEHKRLSEIHAALWRQYRKTPWWRLIRRHRLRRSAHHAFTLLCAIFDEATALYHSKDAP